jgi:hypothetical protein
VKNDPVKAGANGAGQPFAKKHTREALHEYSGQLLRKKARGKQSDGGIVARVTCGVKRKGYEMLWWGCRREGKPKICRAAKKYEHFR